MSRQATRRVTGAEGLFEALGDLLTDGSEVLLIVDAGLLDSAASPIPALLGKLPAAERLVVRPAPAPLDVRALESLIKHVADHRAVVAVGGGRVMDAAKIATSGARFLSELYGGAGGAAFAAPIAPRTPLVVVPTTIGTGSEVSGKAVLQTEVARLLLLGNSLAPTVACIVPEVLATLPDALVLMGGAEIVLRFLGPWVGLGRRPPEASRLAAARTVTAVAEALAPDKEAAARGRQLLFDLSAGAHDDAALPQGAPFAYWLWPVANEWAFVTGEPKMTAVLRLLPDWLSCLAARGADHDILELCALIPRRLPHPPGAEKDRLDLVLDRVERHWRPVGDGLPTRTELTEVFGGPPTQIPDRWLISPSLEATR